MSNPAIRGPRPRLLALFAGALLLVGLVPLPATAVTREGVMDATAWRQVSMGFSGACGLDSDGVTFCWGNSIGGSSDEPQRLSGAPRFASISVGNDHACGIAASDGTAWCWGYNTWGQLGDGTETNSTSPVRVSGGTAYRVISAGNYYTCAIASDGAAWCWGYNNANQLGSAVTSQTSPIAVPGGNAFRTVSAGSQHACAIAASDGAAWCWGFNGFGQLGAGDDDQGRTTPVLVVGGNVYRTIGAGNESTCAVAASDGAAWCWGRNQKGQLGLGTTTDSFSPARVGSNAYATIDVGWRHACALALSDGSAWCWGENGGGRLGTGDAAAQLTSPTRVDTASGRPRAFASVSAGTTATCAIDPADVAWCWGNDGDRQLGDGGWRPNTVSPQSQPLPVPVGGPRSWRILSAGYLTTCALDTDGAAWCWGINGDGQLGNGTTTQQTAPGRVSGTERFRAIATGRSHTCAIGTSDGAAWCWGSNGFGQLGDGTQTDRTFPTRAAGGRAFATIDTASGSQIEFFTCALDASDGSAWCWGRNSVGQLGDGTQTDRTVPTLVVGGNVYSDVGVGARHACAIAASDGSAWCWGYNGSGQLGNGTQTDASAPVPVAGGNAWKAISVGTDHTCAIAASDGSAWCWGSNADGRLGLGSASSAAQVSSPAPVTTTESFPGPWIAISAGEAHTCAVGYGLGGPYCWGKGADGQLGNGGTGNTPYPGGVDTTSPRPAYYGTIAAGGSHSCAISRVGPITCWGSDSNGQVGNGTIRREPRTYLLPVTLPYAGTVTKATCKSANPTSYVFALDAYPGSGVSFSSLEVYPGAGGDGIGLKTLKAPATSATFRGSATGLNASLRFVLIDAAGRQVSSVTVGCT